MDKLKQSGKKRILLIEDDSSIRETISDLLELEGFELKIAVNGVEGIEFAKTLMPDLIISDVMMPELNGHDVITELKKDPLTAEIPFIFLSAMAEKKDAALGIELGADDYLTKPFANEELINAIKKRLYLNDD